MIKQVPGKIYLADQRGVVESPQFRRQSTFSFGAFQHAHKGPFGRLYGLNEETLAGGHAVAFAAEQASYVLLLPITGAVAYHTEGATRGTAEAEELLTLALPAGTMLHLRNPYEHEVISLLHLWLAAPAPLAAPALALKTVFDGALLENQLAALVGFEPPAGQPPAFAQPLPFALSLGRFMGRQEAVYKVARPGNQLFAFVLAGAFELESRLLHEKDAVALWEVEEIELEALSNHALLLVLELTP